jgi:methylated-DNA-[protein]-cysteine S-methyltransferase
MYYSSIYPSPVGDLTLAGDGESLVGLWIDATPCGGHKQKYFLGTLPEIPVKNDNLALFKKAKLWLEEYFAGGKPDASTLPLSPIGSKFRQEVWKILLSIPYGKVSTYGAIAKKMAAKMGLESMSAQAVGGAVGHNPISIIIPCHRVIGANGSLTGYAAGIETKIKLLKLEGLVLSGNRLIPISG